MDRNKWKILLVEDDEEDYLLTRELLTEGAGSDFDLRWVTTPEAALEILAQSAVDVILVDYRLGARDGLDLVREVTHRRYDVPIILLTGYGSRDIDVKAMEAGAVDYLQKSEATAPLLERAVRYAIERRRLQTELAEAHKRERHQRELESFETYTTRTTHTAVTTRAYEFPSLRESAQDTFGELVGHYSRLLDQALEQQAYRVDYDIGDELRTMAGEICFLKGGPRDVIEIHLQVMRKKGRGANPKKASAYAEEGRMLVLELMGYLVSQYRSSALSLYWNSERGSGSGPNESP